MKQAKCIGKVMMPDRKEANVVNSIFDGSSISNRKRVVTKARPGEKRRALSLVADSSLTVEFKNSHSTLPESETVHFI